MRSLYMFLVLGLLSFASVSQAAQNCEDGDDEQVVFEVIGVSCVDPIWGQEPEINNPRQAKLDAERKALEVCYPYQAHRESGFSVSLSDDCPSRFHGRQATAMYSCAR